MNEVVESYLVGGAFIAAGLLIGLLLETILLKALIKKEIKSFSKINNAIFISFRYLLTFWGILLGIYLGLRYIALSEYLYKVVHKLFFVSFAISIALFISRIFIGLIKLSIAKAPGLLPSTTIISTITRIVVLMIAVLIILQTLGISIAPLLTALGIGGFAVALALQETLTNFFAGVQVIASQQIHPGDYIKLNTGEEGYITDITWRSTSIRMLSGSLIVVPNSKISSANLTNYYRPDKEISVLIEIRVSYNSDLKKVEDITIDAAKSVLIETQGGVEHFQPFIRYHSFNHSSIDFTVILRVKEFTDQYLVKHQFIKSIHQVYKENSIEIPYPIHDVRLKKI